MSLYTVICTLLLYVGSHFSGSILHYSEPFDYTCVSVEEFTSDYACAIWWSDHELSVYGTDHPESFYDGDTIWRGWADITIIETRRGIRIIELWEY